ncbi:MAG: response regulator, partial [Steroidobacteraceae bacterium]
MWRDSRSKPRHIERRPSVWIVDDSPTDAERVRRLLAAEHDVDVLHDGAAMLERLASSSLPDLIVLDWVMPGISGIEACRYVRSAAGKLPLVPILLLTVRHGSQEILQAFEAGANDYVSKPFVDEELRARVGALVGGKRLLERAEQAEADVRSILTHAPDPIFCVDAQNVVSFVNDEGLRALELTEEQVLGKPLSEIVHGLGLGLSNINVGPGESFLPVPDVQIGSRTFSPAIRVLPSDSAASTTIALRDVTARRRAEVRRLDFYSVVAHDVRSPIAAVLQRLELAFRGRHGILPAGLLADLRKIEGS